MGGVGGLTEGDLSARISRASSTRASSASSSPTPLRAGLKSDLKSDFKSDIDAEMSEADEADDPDQASRLSKRVARRVSEGSSQGDTGGGNDGAPAAAADVTADATIDATANARLSSQRHSMRPGAAAGGRRDTFSGLRQQRHSMISGNLGAKARSSVTLRGSLVQRRATGQLNLPPTNWSGLGLEEAGALLLRGLRRTPAAVQQYDHVPPSVTDQVAAARWVQCAFRRWHLRHHDPTAERAVLHISISSARRSNRTQRLPPTLPPTPNPTPKPRPPTPDPDPDPSTPTLTLTRPRPEAGFPAAQQGGPRRFGPLLPVHALGPVHQRRTADHGVPLQPAAEVGRGLPPAHPHRGRARAARRGASRHAHRTATCTCTPHYNMHTARNMHACQGLLS